MVYDLGRAHSRGLQPINRTVGRSDGPERHTTVQKLTWNEQGNRRPCPSRPMKLSRARPRDASSNRVEAAPPAPRLPLRARRAAASALSPARDSAPRLRPAPNGPHGPLCPDPPSRGRWGRFARVAARHDRRLRARRVGAAHARGRRHAQPPTTHARNARAARPEPGGYRLTLTGKLLCCECGARARACCL